MPKTDSQSSIGTKMLSCYSVELYQMHEFFLKSSIVQVCIGLKKYTEMDNTLLTKRKDTGKQILYVPSAAGADTEYKLTVAH